MNHIAAHPQPGQVSVAICTSSKAPVQGSNFRHTRVYHRHIRAFPVSDKKQLNVFCDRDGDSRNNAQDNAGDALGSLNQYRQDSQSSVSTREPLESQCSLNELPLTTPRLALRDRTNVNLDDKTPCSSKPSYTGKTWEGPSNNSGTKFTVPLIPLRNTMLTKDGSAGDEKFSHSGSHATTDSAIGQLYADADRILAEQKKRDLDRLRAQLAALPSKPRPRWLDLKKFAAYRKKSGYSEGLERLSDPKSAPAQVETFGSGGNEAATNQWCTEGRLKVRCLLSTLNLPIAPDTTTSDVKSAAAIIVPHDADFNTIVVVECIVAEGLERDLRGYENVRDLMSYWGPCHDNFLRVDLRSASRAEQDPTGGVAPHADSSRVASSFLLQHAPRLKDLKERWVTLREDGQLFAIDSEDYCPDKAEALCHLSMYDIYTFSKRGFKHHRGTPGNFCYALKSQKKPGFCLDTIHFFCTADAALAERFYRQVYCWRSRYLVRRKVGIDGRQLVSEESGALRRPVDFSTSATRSWGLSNASDSLRSSSEESGHSMPSIKEYRGNVSLRGKPEGNQDAGPDLISGSHCEIDNDHIPPITP